MPTTFPNTFGLQLLAPLAHSYGELSLVLFGT